MTVPVQYNQTGSQGFSSLLHPTPSLGITPSGAPQNDSNHRATLCSAYMPDKELTHGSSKFTQLFHKPGLKYLSRMNSTVCG